MTRFVRLLIVGTLTLGPVPLVAAPAMAAGSDNGGCGSSFALVTTSTFEAILVNEYGGSASDYAAFIAAVNKNGDDSLCWHYNGKTCSCGGTGITVVDNNATVKESD